MLRQFELIPDIAFHKVVRNYAFIMGKPVFTWDQQKVALANYINYATLLN